MVRNEAKMREELTSIDKQTEVFGLSGEIYFLILSPQLVTIIFQLNLRNCL